MRFDQLRVFAAIADTLQVTAAARRLNRSTSAVSEAMRELELGLGVELVDRTRRQWRLTAAGDRLLPYARSILALAEEARIETIGTGPAIGTLSLGALETLASRMLPPLLDRFAIDYSGVKPVLTVASSGELAASVERGDLDLAVVLDEARAKGLNTRKIAEQRLVVALPRGHPLSDQASLRLRELEGLPFLVTKTGCTFRAMFDDLFANHHASPIIAGEIGSIAAAQAMVASGHGAALLPECAVDTAKVAAVALDPDLPRVPVRLIWKRRPRQRAVLRAFLACVSDG